MPDRLPPAPRRVPLAGSTLVRALAALGDADAPGEVEAFAPRLARWVDWTHAIALAATLAEPTQRSKSAAAAGVCPPADGHLRERARVRDTLTARAREVAANADDASWRPRYTACQQAMEARIGPLRARLRTALAAGPPPLAKLASLDAVMEGVLAPREQALLAGVAGRLEGRLAASRDKSSSPDGEPGASIAPFRADLERLLLAELDLRLQPVDALWSALQPSE